jgi:hypothetical protein
LSERALLANASTNNAYVFAAATYLCRLASTSCHNKCSDFVFYDANKSSFLLSFFHQKNFLAHCHEAALTQENDAFNFDLSSTPISDDRLVKKTI